jgi:transcriptional regulator with XRE-family HTH domain
VLLYSFTCVSRYSHITSYYMSQEVVQAKSYRKLYPRIEALKHKRNWTWEEVAKELDLSVAMLMLVKSGRRHLSNRAHYRLCEAERTAGIYNDDNVLGEGAGFYPSIEKTGQAQEENVQSSRSVTPPSSGRAMKHLLDDVTGATKQESTKLEESVNDLREIYQADPEIGKQISQIITTYRKTIRRKKPK